MGIFSKIHAYVLLKTRREFIHLRRLLMQTRRLLEILEIGCFVAMNSCFLLAHFLFIPKFAYPAIGTKHSKQPFL